MTPVDDLRRLVADMDDLLNTWKRGVPSWNGMSARGTRIATEAHLSDVMVRLNVVRHRLAAAESQREALRAALERALTWIAEDCRPDADWAAQGHNWSMSPDDRERGISVLEQARAALKEQSR